MRRSLAVSHTHTTFDGERKYCVVFRDVTERNRVQAEVRRERNRAESYLDVASVIFVGINADQTVAVINRRGCKLLGRNKSQVIGKNWFSKFIPKRDREHVRSAFVALMKGKFKSVEYFENPIVDANGQERLIAWHNTLLRDGEGKITGTLSCGQDVTERKQAEESLARSEEQYRRLVTSMNEGLAALDEANRITFVNDKFCRMLGYTPKELLGRHSSCTHSQADQKVVTKQGALQKKGAHTPFEVAFIRKDGSRMMGVVLYWFSLNWAHAQFG